LVSEIRCLIKIPLRPYPVSAAMISLNIGLVFKLTVGATLQLRRFEQTSFKADVTTVVQNMDMDCFAQNKPGA